MSLLLCRRERVKHPFYIEVLGIHIYSSQELCYVIYHHPLLVMNDFADASLFSFIKNELDLVFSWPYGKADRSRGNRKRLYIFLQNVIITEKEAQKFKQTAASYRNLLNMPEKAVADYLFPENSMEERCSAIKGL